MSIIQYIVKTTKYNKKFEKFLDETRVELDKFFKIKMDLPFVFLINSRQEINKIWGKKTKRWLTGWVKQNNIFILNPEIYIKESDHKSLDHFWKTLKHEYCHLYYKKITGTNYPKWLNEGLACLLAGQAKPNPTQKEALLVFQYYKKTDWQIFKIGFFWVNLLLNKFGKKKMLLLLKNINSKITQKQFRKSFYKVYKFRFNKKNLVNFAR